MEATNALALVAQPAVDTRVTLVVDEQVPFVFVAVSLADQKKRLRLYIDGRKPVQRAQSFLSNLQRFKRDMEDRDVVGEFKRQRVASGPAPPPVIEERPPFDHMHICRREAETVAVFTQQHLDQLVACGFQHVENVVYYAASATLPFVRPAPRRAQPVHLSVATVDAVIDEPQEM